MKKIIRMLFAIGLMVGSVAADLTIVDIDNATTDLIPTLIVEGDAATAGGSASRWGSVTITNTDFIGVTADPATSTDVYVQWPGLAVPVNSARYIQVHYEVIGTGFSGNNHRLFPATSAVGGGINMANDALIPGTPGTHSFIIDMFSDPTSKDYEGGGGNWTAFRWDPWNESSLTINAGKTIRIDKIVFGNTLGAVVDAYYVSSTPTDWTNPAAWSDSFAARAGVSYYATNSVVLETPAVSSTFPGLSLNLSAPQRMELMVSGPDVITVDALNMDGADLGVGSGSGEAKIAGTINVNSDSTFSGATDNSKDLRVQSHVIAGSVAVTLDAPAKTIYIDNPTNDVNGTWIVENGTAEFASPGAVGAANIQVRSNGTLRITGNWDGTLMGGSLTVIDSPNALVDLSTYNWTAGNLTIGGSNVPPYSTYTVAELNAFASNAVFTGSGSLYVGPPPPDTYYLQANVPANHWIGENEYWFDAPVGGNPMPSSQIFPGSTFDVNGFAWRSKNQSATSVFDGLLVVNDTAGSGLYSAYGGDMRLEGGMILSNSVIARPHRSPAGTYVSDLQTGPSGVFLFRTLIFSGKTNNVQNVSMGTISGPGKIQFGGNQSYDPIGVWSLSVTETSTNFTGTIDLQDGELTFANEVQLPNADFFIGVDVGDENTVVLSNAVVFGSLTYGTTVLTTGTYTAAQLNSALGTSRFSGLGSISFQLPVADFAAWAAGLGLTGNDALPNTDIEPDGMDNLLEYALGGNPTNDDAAVYLPKSTVAGGAVEYTYNRRLDAAARGLTYDVILNTDLVNGSWSNIGQTAETGTGAIDQDFESVTNQIPTDAAVKFISLEVTEN